MARKRQEDNFRINFPSRLFLMFPCRSPSARILCRSGSLLRASKFDPSSPIVCRFSRKLSGDIIGMSLQRFCKMIKAQSGSVPKYGKNKPAAAPKNNRSAVSNRKDRCPKRRENRSLQDLHFRDWKHGKRKEDTGMNTAGEKENRKNLKMADSIASLTAQKAAALIL